MQQEQGTSFALSITTKNLTALLKSYSRTVHIGSGCLQKEISLPERNYILTMGKLPSSDSVITKSVC